MLDFYKTRGGHMFIDHTIPRLSKNIEELSNNMKILQKKARQYCINAKTECIYDVVTEELKNGSCFVSSINTNAVHTILIFEKEDESDE